ncbi:MAG: carbohydrate kinase family protein [Melioribacteraceae bacterium]|nr:carbohydrate kinase family protein [Melioribacteraceae bacterium]MCF8394705.1 carbohydrate kinase family protein [Melioribacteraceae bacterium]MCF8418090.1 carbohydrate kinase family protein [Melioribacteraceae bacterium]
MKILVIGHSVVDKIEDNSGIKCQPGGVFYTSLGFNQMLDKEDELYLLTAIDESSYNYFSKVYDRVNLDYSIKTEKIPEVYLRIKEDEDRYEAYCNLSDKLDVSVIDDFNQFDGIFINMISGFDISLDDLKYVRKNYNGKIHIDIHSLAKGVVVKTERKYRPVPGIEDWLKNVDIIQANENELRTISTKEIEFKAADEILLNENQILLITKGNKGNRSFIKRKDGLKSFFVKAIDIESINYVGCGDIFGSVFFYSYIRGLNLYDSQKIANKAAGVITRYNSIEEFYMMREDLNG